MPRSQHRPVAHDQIAPISPRRRTMGSRRRVSHGDCSADRAEVGKLGSAVSAAVYGAAGEAQRDRHALEGSVASAPGSGAI
jgi:hypothetical protein